MFRRLGTLNTRESEDLPVMRIRPISFKNGSIESPLLRNELSVNNGSV